MEFSGDILMTNNKPQRRFYRISITHPYFYSDGADGGFEDDSVNTTFMLTPEGDLLEFHEGDTGKYTTRKEKFNSMQDLWTWMTDVMGWTIMQVY